MPPPPPACPAIEGLCQPAEGFDIADDPGDVMGMLNDDPDADDSCCEDTIACVGVILVFSEPGKSSGEQIQNRRELVADPAVSSARVSKEGERRRLQHRKERPTIMSGNRFGWGLEKHANVPKREPHSRRGNT